jgi:hypothetical protein
MKWSEKIQEWKDGIPQTYPDNIIEKFFYETTKCTLVGDYEEKFIESKRLSSETKRQTYKSFQRYIEESPNDYVTLFYNLSGDTLLIIPIPRKDLSFTTIKDFIDNADEDQQIAFWKFVGCAIEKYVHDNGHAYVSTHGLGVPYFHLRISKIPKYYITRSFIK